MPTILLAALIAASALTPALAQAPARPRSPEKPLDRGPYTPEANRAYQGGGVILQGAPGAPAPTPQATPPGQAPSNMVPAR